MRTRSVVSGGLVLAVVAGLGIWLLVRQVGQVQLSFSGRSCTVQGEGQVDLDSQQMANAATIAAIGIKRRMPEQAVVVALATAYQESGLRNLAGGDRDSVGLFQQRPSQGWGTPEQIGDPRYAANKFYAALKKVRGWEEMRVTDAAQAVQRSAFPEAYEKWSGDSQVLTRALLGQVTGAVACRVGAEPSLRGQAATTALAKGLRQDWGLPEAESAADPTALVVPAAGERDGWRYAHWLVAHAQEHGVKRIHFADREWTAERGTWRSADSGEGSGDRVRAEVHAEV